MEAVRKKFGVEAKFSAPFHYKSHGRIERAQATIEIILRKFARDNLKQWDKLIPYIHFALRQFPHSATGVSPAELVWGRQMKGLLQVIRETWTKKPNAEILQNVDMRVHESTKRQN